MWYPPSPVRHSGRGCVAGRAEEAAFPRGETARVDFGIVIVLGTLRDRCYRVAVAAHALDTQVARRVAKPALPRASLGTVIFAYTRLMKSLPIFCGAMRLALLTGLLALPCFAQPPTPRLISTQPSLSLSPDYVGVGIQSRCGDDWIFLYTAEWACLRRQGDRLALISAGAYSGPPSSALWQRLVRGPTATDPKVYMAIYDFAFGPVVAIDPITGASNAVGYISRPPLEPVVHADRDGDGHLELVSVGPASTSLIALPGGPQTPFQILARMDTHSHSSKF